MSDLSAPLPRSVEPCELRELTACSTVVPPRLAGSWESRRAKLYPNRDLQTTSVRGIFTMNRPRALLVAIAAALLLNAPATAASSYPRFYVDELFMGNTLESRGAYYQGGKLAIDNAACLGLRRFGVQTSTYGLDKFWRFKCTLNGADGHAYDAQVSVTHGPIGGNVYWHFLSVKRLY